MEKHVERLEKLLRETEKLKDELTQIAETIQEQGLGLQVEVLPHIQRIAETINKIETAIIILKKDLTKNKRSDMIK